MQNFNDFYKGTDFDLYVELFSGRYSLMLSKLPTTTEIYNDERGLLREFFRVMRDDCERFAVFLERGVGRRRDLWLELKDFLSGIEDIDLKLFEREMRQIKGFRSISRELRKELASYDLNLTYLTERMRNIQLEDRNWDNIVERMDGNKTLFYVDWSGVGEKDNFVEDLLKQVKKGTVLIGGYDVRSEGDNIMREVSDLIDKYYELELEEGIFIMLGEG